MQREVAARIPHQALGLAQQDLVAPQAKDKVGVANSQDQGHQFRIGEVTIAAQQDVGLRPVLA